MQDKTRRSTEQKIENSIMCMYGTKERDNQGQQQTKTRVFLFSPNNACYSVCSMTTCVVCTYYVCSEESFKTICIKPMQISYILYHLRYTESIIKNLGGIGRPNSSKVSFYNIIHILKEILSHISMYPPLLQINFRDFSPSSSSLFASL